MSVLNAVSGCSFMGSVLSAVHDRGGSPKLDGAFTAACRGHRASSWGRYTGEWSQEDYSDIFVSYSERGFYLANWRVGVNRFAVSSHIRMQIGFESGRRACLACLHHLPSLGCNHLFWEVLSATTAVCNNHSSTDSTVHVFLQSWSPIAKAASLKATDLKADPPAECCAGSCRAGREAKTRKAVMHCKATIRLCFTGEETETDGEQVNCSKCYE